MRLGDWLEVIDETIASYRKKCRLVDLTSFGNLIVELHGRRHVEVNAHQVDLATPPFVPLVWWVLEFPDWWSA